MQKINLTINPCQENWETMTPEEKGRFCAVCQKTVIDFTNAGPRDIAQVIQRSGMDFCGRYNDSNQSYTNRKINEANHIKYSWLKSMAFAVLMLIYLTPARAQVKNNETGNKSDNDENKPGKKAKRATKIRGYVRDADDKTDVAFASVKVYQDGKIINTCTTNECGEFTIELPAGTYTEDSFDVRVDYLGYRTQVLKGIKTGMKEYVFNIELTTQVLEINVQVLGYNPNGTGSYGGAPVITHTFFNGLYYDDFLMIQDGDHTFIPGSTIRKMAH